MNFFLLEPIFLGLYHKTVFSLGIFSDLEIISYCIQGNIRLRIIFPWFSTGEFKTANYNVSNDLSLNTIVSRRIQDGVKLFAKRKLHVSKIYLYTVLYQRSRSAQTKIFSLFFFFYILCKLCFTHRLLVE